MIKKALVLFSIFSVCFVTNSYAQVFEDYQWHDKLSRGVVNVVTSPVEIVRGVDLTTKQSNVAKGWTVGLVKGLAGMGLRIGTGLVDIVTFPLNWPDEDKAPLMDPQYVWQDWGGEYLD